MKKINLYKFNKSAYSTHSLVMKAVGTNKTVLDIGCNDGYIGFASDRSNKFYGIDNAAESIKIAKKNYKDAAVYDLNKLERLPWKIKFDVLIFADVLEHILYPERALSFFVKNYLKDDGEVILGLPNIANLQIRIRLFAGNFNYTDVGIMDRTHLHFYTFKTARILARKANLKIKSETGGSSNFGIILQFLPLLNGLLANNIIMICKRK